MTPNDTDDRDIAETDALLRDLFHDADEPRIAANLHRRAMELAIDPAHHAAVFVRRCVRVMNVLGILLIGVILWTGYQNVLGTMSTTSTTAAATTTTTTSSTMVSVMEILGAALLLFAAAGTQWAFRAPANEPHLLAV